MHKTYDFEEFGYLRSGKRYKLEHKDYFLEYCLSSSSRAKSNPPITSREESGLTPPTLQRTIGRKANPTVCSQIPPSGQGTPTAQKPQPPHRNTMGDDMKLSVFRGTGLEDPKQHWFLCEVVWNVKQVTDDDIKMAQLTTMFRDRALN